MKRLLLCAGVFVLLAAGAGAGGRGDTGGRDGKVSVVATIFPPYDFVREVAGNRVNLTMLLPPAAESHSFEPTPRDIITVQNCDVFIYVGGESDAWVETILESMDTSRMKIISLMDCVEVVEELVVEGMQDEEEGHSHGHEETFTLADVKDRVLTDWEGDWQSVYPHLLDGTLDPVWEHRAEEGEKTAREHFEEAKTHYVTDVDRVVITADSMSFYINGVPATARYAYRGTGVIGEDGEDLWVRYKFEALGNPPRGAPKYIMFSDHLHAPAKTEHFHIYASDRSFDELMADENPVHYPTYYASALTKSDLVAEMIGHDHEEVEYDEHVWTSPRNAQLIVRNIAEVLKSVDPPNAAEYEKNAAAYAAKLTELDASFLEALRGARRKTLVFGDRFPFRYFADAYGLSYFAAFPGCSTETEASAATVAFLIDKVRAEKIPVVFHIELSNEKIADTICEETGAQKLLLHAVHNVSKRDFEGGASYYSLMS
ncbi:MAG: zinc ABC transporter substrate-binding protein, partial [Treponema sp.]|nr:zinc ABC transporter substrate-binding protein [Treponema sp.]